MIKINNILIPWKSIGYTIEALHYFLSIIQLVSVLQEIGFQELFKKSKHLQKHFSPTISQIFYLCFSKYFRSQKMHQKLNNRVAKLPQYTIESQRFVLNTFIAGVWDTSLLVLGNNPLSHYFCATLQLHNSPVDGAIELFKPSKDLVSLPVCIEKKFWVSGFLQVKS